MEYIDILKEDPWLLGYREGYDGIPKRFHDEEAVGYSDYMKGYEIGVRQAENEARILGKLKPVSIFDFTRLNSETIPHKKS
jgi:hypothetical protein